MFHNDIGTNVNTISLEQAQVRHAIQQRRRIDYRNVNLCVYLVVSFGLAFLVVVNVAV
jgi:hypothetical protein